MDIVNTVSLGGSGNTPSLPQTVEHAPAPKTVEATPAKSEDNDPVNTDDRRLAAVKNAISKMFPNSGQRFTIYKDAAGEYRTSVRDLETGQVKTYPEPEVLDNLTRNILDTLA